MSYKLTVTPSEDVNLWLIFVDGRPVEGFNRDGEKLLTLSVGEHRLSYLINGPGGAITLDLDGRPDIIVPPGKTWPVTDEVPDGETGTSNRIYFEIRS